MVKNKLACANVISSLLKNPQLLVDDNYPLTPDDFPERFHKIIFAAIDHLVHSGARQIDEIVIDDYLSQYPAQHKVFSDNRGIEYLQNAKEISDLNNYEYYYDQVKKCSLLSQLEERGYNITPFHDPDNMATDLAQKAQARMDSSTLDDIISFYDVQLSELRSTYCSGSDLVEGHISKGMRELKEELAETPAFGLPMNSAKMNTICHGRRLRKFYLKTLPSGIGKALVNDALIPTYDKGFMRVDQIRPGDKLIGKNGLPTTVLAIHPQPEKKRVYRVHFADGRYTDCCKDHLWTYRYKNESIRTDSVESIINKQKELGEIQIPLCKPVQYEEKIFLLPPYDTGYGCAVSGKPFPEEYLFGSLNQRVELLRGICDVLSRPCSKGSELRNLFFDKIDSMLRRQIISLLHGLAVSIKAISSGGIIFSTEKKERTFLPVLYIEELDEYKDMTCFTVDAPDALFLCNDYIVTHNTRLSMADACRLAIPEYYDPEKKRWVKTKCSESVLFITTELELAEIQTLTWAYIACVPEDHITDHKYAPG